MKFIDLKSQYESIKEKIDKRILAVLDHGQYIMGPEVYELEERLAEYVGVKHAISCANGTDALQLALLALGIKNKNDVVFCPTFTFFASGESISFVGATPVFVDSEPGTFNICPVDLENKILKILEHENYQPKAIMAVDLFGLPANYPLLKIISEKYNLPIIEDCAQGFGGEINGKKSGSFGDIATTSFFPAKPLGCYGDGGAVFTDDDGYFEVIESLRMHGKGVNKYNNVRIGMNSRLDTIQAAVLLEKMKVFDEEMRSRELLSKKYNDDLQAICETPKLPCGYRSSWAQYTIRTKNRAGLIKEFNKNNIPYFIYYEKCLHHQDAFKEILPRVEDFKIAEKDSETVLSLPMNSYLQDFEYKRIIDSFVSSNE